MPPEMTPVQITAPLATTTAAAGRIGPHRRIGVAAALVLMATTFLTAPPLSSVVRAAAPIQVGPVATGTLPGSFADLADRVSPAVVNISTTQSVKRGGLDMMPGMPGMPGMPFDAPFQEFFRRFYDQQQPGGDEHDPDSGPGRDRTEKATSLGSGFIIDAEGHVVTNNHVVDDAQDITVTLHDGTELKATLVGRDEKTDLALLKVKSDQPLPYLGFGDSDKARVGDWVLAVGNPFGLGGTVTAGIVSARGRDIQQGPYDDFLQLDASINRGNSGGPTFDMAGNVIGINTAIYSPNGGSVGIGFAIPANLARPVIEQLKTSGHVERGWLGVQIQQITPDIAESLGLDGAKGALVADVMPDSPAAKAGMKQGDVILSLDGKAVDSIRDVTRHVAGVRKGSTLELGILRNGSRQTVAARIESMPDDKRMAAATPDEATPSGGDIAGLRLSALDGTARKRFDIADTVKGVVVTGLVRKAGELPLRPGDVIVAINNEPVSDIGQIQKKIREAETAGRKSVLLLVNRGGEQRFMTLNITQS